MTRVKSRSGHGEDWSPGNVYDKSDEPPRRDPRVGVKKEKKKRKSFILNKHVTYYVYTDTFVLYYKFL